MAEGKKGRNTKKDSGKGGKNGEGKLTGNQMSFCLEYVKANGNATEAYKNSSYKSKSMKESTIANNAYKLLQNNDILTRIEKLQSEVIEEVKKGIGFGLQDTLKGVVKLAKGAERDGDKIKALDMLMKHFGGYEKDNEQGKSEVNIPITHWVNEGGEATEKDFDEAFDDID